MTKLIIHIGYPRTASTLIQSILKKFSSIHYIDITRQPWDKINHDILYARENHIKRSQEEYRSEIKKHIELNGKDKVYFYSNETLTSSSFIFRHRPRPNIWTNDPVTIARKLKIFLALDDIFDEVNILIGLRNQCSILKSIYSQTYAIAFGLYKETNNFNKFFNYTFKENYYGFSSDALYYDLIVEEYINIFKKENTLIYFLEEFEKNEFSRFSKELGNKISIKHELIANKLANNHLNKLALNHKEKGSATRPLTDFLSIFQGRYLPSFKGRWIQHTLIWKLIAKIKIQPSKSSFVSLKPSQIKFIKEKYRASNLKLSKYLKIDLKRYGFF